MAYITGSGTVPGAVAEMLAAGVNMNVGGWQLSPAASEIEHDLMRWFGRRFGLPDDERRPAGLGRRDGEPDRAQARARPRAGWDVRGWESAAGPADGDLCDRRDARRCPTARVDTLGLGMDARAAGCRSMTELRMRPDLLRDQVRATGRPGLRPIAVVATAGTTSTGAIDPLPEIADVCAEQGLWMHVDAAYGGPAVLADDLRPLMAGIERADSIAFDPHKWLYIAAVRGLRAGPRRAADAGFVPDLRGLRPRRTRSTPAPASASASWARSTAAASRR